MNRAERGHPRMKEGFALVETVVVLAIAGIILLFAGTLTTRMYCRYQMISAVHEVQAMVLATRMLAVRTNGYAVISFDTANNFVYSWIDKNGNFVRDADEPIRFMFQIPPISKFATPFNAGGDKAGVLYDTYQGNKKIVDSMVFCGDGSIVDPQCTKCDPPRPTYMEGFASDVPYGSIDCRGTNIPSTGLPPLHGQFNSNNGMGCRGIYMTKMLRGMETDDVFRISVDQSRAGRVSVLKWVGRHQRGGMLFVPANPAWIWFD